MENYVQDNAAPEKAPQKQNIDAVNAALKLAALPVAAASGAWVAHTSVRSSMYRTISNSKSFKAIETKFNAKYDANEELLVKKLIDNKAYSENWSAIRAEHGKEVQALMKMFGVEGFFQKFQKLNRSNKQNAIIAGMSAAGISIGAIFAIADMKVLNGLLGQSNNIADPTHER